MLVAEQLATSSSQSSLGSCEILANPCRGERNSTIVAVFVDTNVFVYQFDLSEPTKQARCSSWLESLWNDGQGRLSVQVLQELYVTLTGPKLKQPVDPSEARIAIEALFSSWDPLVLDRSTFQGAWALQDRYSLSWWDALIVSAAQSLGCSTLLTEDLSHGQDLDGVRVVSPFEMEPGLLS